VPKAAAAGCAIVCGLGILLVGRETRQRRLNSELIRAISRQQEDRAQALLGVGADASARESDAKPTNFRDMVMEFTRHFFHRGAEARRPNTENRSTLLLYYDLVRFDPNTKVYAGRGRPHAPQERLCLALLNAGAPPNDRDAKGFSVLYWAAYFHHHRVVRQLAKSGANLNVATVASKSSPLMRADFEDSAVLVNHGASIEQVDYVGKSALFHADAAKAELLLAHGANIEARDTRKVTPLMWACSGHDEKLIQVLLAHQAKLNSSNAAGVTPTLFASAECSLKTLQSLVRAGGDPRAKDRAGNTALMFAIDNPDHRVFVWLLSQGIDVNARGAGGNTAMTISEDDAASADDAGKPSKRYVEYISQLKKRGAMAGMVHGDWPGEPY